MLRRLRLNIQVLRLAFMPLAFFVGYTVAFVLK